MEQEEQKENKGLWKQMQEAKERGEVKEYTIQPYSIKDIEDLFKQSWEENKRYQEESLKDWPDIGTWPEDLPEGVYQGSIAGSRGYYSTKFRDQLKEAAKKMYDAQKNTAKEKTRNTEQE